MSDGEALHRELRSRGVQYLIVNHQRRRIPLPTDAAFSTRFRVLWSSSSVWLFELTD
jgi:hypothetical protein